MIFNKSICLILAMFLLLLSACDEDTALPVTYGSLKGEVLLDSDLTPIRDVEITTTPTTTTILTDSLGQFFLEEIVTNTYNVQASKSGFALKVESVIVNRNQVNEVTILLSADTVSNVLPTVPLLTAPADNATEIPTSVRLEWNASDFDNDDLYYDVTVYEGQQNNPVFSEIGIRDTFVDLANLAYGTTYFWQVSVTDNASEPVFGMTWRFTTANFPNHRYLFARETNGIYHIYSADGLGEELQLTDGPASSWRPVPNPAGNKIAFISNAGIENHIYMMNRDGSDIQQLTTFPIDGGTPQELDFSWAPDGGSILYTSNTNLRIVDADGTGQSVFFEAPAGYTFVESQWSPIQGDQILVRTQGILPYTSQIWLLDSSGNFESTLVPDEPGSTGGGVFSLDGQRILYTRDLSGFESTTGRQLDASIILMNINNGSIANLSINKVNGTNDLDPRYTSDGARVIFTNRVNDNLSAPAIYIMDVDGDNRERLFENASMGVHF